MTTAMTTVRQDGGALQGTLLVSEIREQIQLIQHAMAELMVEGHHYGKIPGCGDKPTLLKPGAEKLGLMFRLAPKFIITRTDLPNGHREIEITCELSSIVSGMFVGSGVGSCSTMETKYRWRNESTFEVTEERIPQDAKEKKSEYRKAGYGMKKIDNEWKWVRYTGSGERSENPDLADVYNTVLKMAKKRAHVDAILTATAASDIFAQDLEDLHHEPPAEEPAPRQARQPSRGGQHASPPADVAYITGDQSDELVELLEATGTDAEQYLGWLAGILNIPTPPAVDRLPASAFTKAKQKLSEKKAKQAIQNAIESGAPV